MTHGDRISSVRHVGDLGNIIVGDDGVCMISFDDQLIKISGPHSIIGRSIIIHENEDDCGMTDHKDSKTTGNSGKRIAYGIIGYA
jgi:Cu-Zn family superoxide dismutase